MRIARRCIFTALALGLLFVGLSVWLIYPVRTTATFDYHGRHFEISHLTLMTIHLCDFKRCFPYFPFEWRPVRANTSLSLPDGSILILAPRWPAPWEANLRIAPYQSTPVWYWLNDGADPMAVVAGDGTQ